MIEKILYNGNIITLDDATPSVSAIAISGNRIVAYGTDDAMLSLATNNTVKENLAGHTVIPGLVDAHLHWGWTSKTLQQVDVFEVPSMQIAIERVAERVATIRPGEWVLGNGWAQGLWAGGAFPTAHDLDAVSPNNPVCLHAKSGHALWVNSAALRHCQITSATPDPEGGQIQRDGNGNPTGILFETAMEIVLTQLPEVDDQQLADYMYIAQDVALASGLTGFHDFDGPACLRSLQMLREQGRLSLRVLKNINDRWIHHAHELGLRRGFGDDWIRIGGLKIFADGALGPMTALMVEPYEGQPHNRGIRVKDKEEILQLVSMASKAGLPSTIHAIGDLAVHDVLDIYELVRKEEAERGEAPSTRRHRIEHVQIIHPDDVGRLAQLEIIASMQPIHATSDYTMADQYWGERSKWAYNPRLQLDHGAVVAFGSDSPVDPFNPFTGIYAAVTRRRPDGSPGPEGWYPEARLTVKEALQGFTTGPAYAAGTEDRLGKLTPGYLADLVVIDRDMMTIPHDDILNIQVQATMVDGRWRFDKR